MELMTIFILAVTVEALIEYVKLIFATQSVNWKQVTALFSGVALALLSNVDLYAALGVTFVVPYVGVVLTGIIFSRGANYVSDFMKLVQNKTAG